MVGQLAFFVVLLLAGWMAVSRSGSARILAVGVAVAAVIAIAEGGELRDLVGGRVSSRAPRRSRSIMCAASRRSCSVILGRAIM